MIITEPMRAKLIEAAIQALDRSHPANPSKLKFGAAVLTRSGEIFASSAFWSDTLSLSVHAEHAALVHAAAHGEREIVGIAAVSTEDEAKERKCHPCGICKQLLYESSLLTGIDLEVVMANLKGEYDLRRISELVPFPWPIQTHQ